jgi:thiol:disulfide interchange protein
MARTDRSAIHTPRAFFVVAAVLLVARFGFTAASATGHSDAQPTAWKTATDADRDILPGTADLVEEPTSNAAGGMGRRPPAKQPEQTFADIPLSDADKESIASGKLVLYEFVSNWSDPCRQMESTALSNRQVSEVIEKNFVPVRITDQVREHGKNQKWIANLQKRYHVFALPTLVIVDQEGEQKASLIGNCSSLTVQRFLARALTQQAH